MARFQEPERSHAASSTLRSTSFRQHRTKFIRHGHLTMTYSYIMKSRPSAMAQLVSNRPFTAKARFQLRVGPFLVFLLSVSTYQALHTRLFMYHPRYIILAIHSVRTLFLFVYIPVLAYCNFFCAWNRNLKLKKKSPCIE